MSGKRIGQTLQIASVYIGAVIGAGFASGQEMIQFFIRFGPRGMIGLFVAGVLHGLVGMMILEVVYEKKWDTYDQLIRTLIGSTLGGILKWTVNLFLFVCFSAMIAGAGAILHQQFGLPIYVGALFMMGASMLTFLSGSKGFVRMNSLLVPILCIGGVLLGAYIMLFGHVDVFAMDGIRQMRNNWLVSAIIYVSYNTLTVMVVLVSLRHLIGSKSVAKWGGLLGGLGLGVLGLSIGGCTLLYYANINTLEIPMLGILLDYPRVFQYLYLLVLVLAMYTTAIANGYGVIENVAGSLKIDKRIFIILMSACGLVGAKFGFSHIVANIFPLFGYIGCFEILMLMVYYMCMKWENRRRFLWSVRLKKRKHRNQGEKRLG